MTEKKAEKILECARGVNSRTADRISPNSNIIPSRGKPKKAMS